MNRFPAAVTACAITFLICAMAGISQAQEEVEEMEFSYGTVAGVSSGEIVINEYDYEGDKEVRVTYKMDPKAGIEGVASAANIAVGDIVEIDYVTEGNKNVAKYISVEKPPKSGENVIEDETGEGYGSPGSYDEDLEYIPEDADLDRE